MIAQDDIQGHWQRRWLRAPGFEDATTQVHWLQAGALYADVRIPARRPDIRGARALSDLSPAGLAQLAQAEGFAGQTEVEGGICTWAREINFHGKTEAVDAGKLDWQGADLVETGVHAEYTELWMRPAEQPAEAQVFRSGAQTAYLVTVGETFVFGLGQADAPADAPMPDLFERVHILGRCVGSEGIALRATNPFLEGRACLERKASGLIYRHIAFDGTERQIHLAALEHEPA